MPSNDADLKTVLRAQEEREQGPNVTGEVLAEMKNSLLFQFNWEEMIQPSPTAISCIGALYVVSISSKAAFDLQTPKDKDFQYLKFVEISGQLIWITL